MKYACSTQCKEPTGVRVIQHHILLQMYRHENLRQMTKDTFTINKDHDGHEFIVQVIRECDKNHCEDDLMQSNDARIYAIPDKYSFNLNTRNSLTFCQNTTNVICNYILV